MELLAQGRDCDVYDRGDGTVLRRSRRAKDQGPEARILQYAAEQGLPVPRVHELADEGRDLIMEKVAGPTMVDRLVEGPWRAKAIGRQLAELHTAVHARPGPDWLPGLPGGDDALLHFDLHPLNVILSPRGPVIIDWNNACRGRPGHDLARAWILMAATEADVPRVLRPALRPIRRALVRSFLDAAGRDEARAGLREAVELTCLDPNISDREKARMQALAAAQAT